MGYYYANNQVVYILPKVFMLNKDNTIFNAPKEQLLNVLKDFRYAKKYAYLRSFCVYFYNSLKEFRHRYSSNEILYHSKLQELHTNLEKNEYSYMDLLLSFVNFYHKHKDYLFYQYHLQKSKHLKRTQWDKTIRKTTPLILPNNQALYLAYYNKKKAIGTNESLLSIFYSILYHFNQEHCLNLRFNGTYFIMKDKAFEGLQQQGLKRLRKIKHCYFNDTLKKMYQLCEIYFNTTQKACARNNSEEFLMVKRYNIVFEDMIDKLLTPCNLEQDLKELKNNQDGKIIDHIFEHQSLIDTSNIFYIGDSKYYKPNSKVSGTSLYKQFSYAKNIIQYNIDLLNNNNSSQYPNTRYRDPISEGYNITPNFFIFGAIEDNRNFKEPHLKPKEEPIMTYHFKERLFDRDTLFVLQYQINFLFVLKAYTHFNESHRKKLQIQIKETLRKDFISYFTSEKSHFTIYLYKDTDGESLVAKHFKTLHGRTFIRSDKKLLLAIHNDDANSKEFFETIKDKFVEFDFSHLIKKTKTN